MDWEASTYYDGGRVVVEKQVNGAWVTVTGLPWVNGPTKQIVGSTPGGFIGFGGDSHGYGSSQVNLSSLAGQTVRVGFRVEGNDSVAYYGWWIDDVRLYSCSSPVPGAPRVTRATAAATSASIAWQPPVYAGSGVRSYRIIRSDKKTLTVSYAARSASLTGVSPAVPLTVTIAAVNGANQVSPVAIARLFPTTSSVVASTARAKKNQPFTVTAKVVRRGTSTVIGAMPVVLQRKVSGATAWSNVATGTTSARGLKAWSVRLTKSTYYRVVTRSAGTSFGSTSAARPVGTR
jgi:hypothetical protein